MRLDCRVSALYYAFFTFIYSKNYERYSASKYTGWRRGVVVSGVRRMNEVNARRAWLKPGWVTVFGRAYLLGMNKPSRSTQPCIPPGSLNRVPASARVRAGMSYLPGGR